MAATAETEQAIRQKVMLLSDLLSRRDPGAVDELWSPGFRLVGSEAGEVAEDRDRLAMLLYRLAAVFEKAAGGWRWRLFCGSEPAAPPAAAELRP